MSILTSLTRIALTRSLKPFEFSNDFSETLDFESCSHLGLYVHLPFCRSLCTFCPYCKIEYNKPLAEQYVNSLLKEIEMVGRQRRSHEPKIVTSLYFGGGTPALLSDAIKPIIDKINEHFTVTEGIGLELHPKDVTLSKLQQLKEAGVTKISIGIQSFQEKYQQVLGRDALDYSVMIEALAAVPFETVSMDFIFALPEQTVDNVISDIEMAFASGANHIAIYPFIDFTFTQRHFEKMSSQVKKKLFYEIVAYCEAKGYKRDSIWTFSKLGDSKYSSMTRENFLGFGCSATTLLKDQFKINTFDLATYEVRIGESQLPTALTLKFTERQRMIYYLFWTAYTMQVDSRAFKAFFGKSLESCYGLSLFLAKALGLVTKEEAHYTMTTKGSYYYHYYEHFYTLSYIDQMWHLMQQEPLPNKLIIN